MASDGPEDHSRSADDQTDPRTELSRPTSKSVQLTDFNRQPPRGLKAKRPSCHLATASNTSSYVVGVGGSALSLSAVRVSRHKPLEEAGYLSSITYHWVGTMLLGLYRRKLDLTSVTLAPADAAERNERL